MQRLPARDEKQPPAGGAAVEEETLCSECGEAPAVRGFDLCEACLREQKRQAELESAAALDDEDVFEDEDEEDGE